MTYEEFLKQTKHLDEKIERLADDVEKYIFEAGVYYMEDRKNASQDHSEEIANYISKAKSAIYEKISLLKWHVVLLNSVADECGAKFALKNELSKLIDQHYDLLLTMGWTGKVGGKDE